LKPKLFIEAVRAPFFTGVIVPTILGAVLAWHSGYPFHWGYFFLTLFGILCIHAGANTINDYFDHLSKNDELNKEYIRPFSGGSRLIQNQIMTPKGILTLSLMMYGIGIVIGLILTFSRGLPILWIGMLGVALGVLYVAPGINLAARGLGELGILIAFGVLCVMGSFYVQAQTFALEPLLLSLPVGLLITAVLWINEFPDFNADKAVGKNHWVIRLGKRRAAVGYTVIMIVTYVLIAVYAVAYNLWLVLALAMFPNALKISSNALKNYDNIPALIPSNAGTIMAHLFTGLLLSGGYVLDKLI
jgi:1,4-dihydroxy-2-naphthoate octaprenyltransferase